MDIDINGMFFRTTTKNKFSILWPPCDNFAINNFIMHQENKNKKKKKQQN